MEAPVVLREAREDDVPELRRLYADSVRRLGPEHYPPEAVAAWASFAEEARFRDFVMTPLSFVAEDDSGVVGFAGVDASGHVVFLYVRGDRGREGIGSRLLSKLLEVGRAEGARNFRTEASELSRPLFARFGFSVVGVEVVDRSGVAFERFRMEKRVDTEPEGPSSV